VLTLPMVERSPKEITQIIKRRIEAMKDVKACHQVSVRVTRKRFDVNMHVLLDSWLSFDEVHRIASDAEREVKTVLPKARVTVRTQPVRHVREDIRTLAKRAGDWLPGSKGVHNVHVQKVDGKLCVDLHLEVSEEMTVKQAHEVSRQIEMKLKAANSNISEITVHMESGPDRISKEMKEDDTELKWFIEHVAKRFDEIKRVHGIKTRRVAMGRHVVLRCQFDPEMSMKEAYKITTNLQNAIKSAYPGIERIDIQEEPEPRYV
jgi:divalent metal cation (Fe/Co/Zn/Cd) transporter